MELLCCCCFETGFLCVALAILEITLPTRLASNSEIRLLLPSAEIKGICGRQKRNSDIDPHEVKEGIHGVLLYLRGKLFLEISLRRLSPIHL